MKRDMDTVRAILLDLESMNGPYFLGQKMALLGGVKTPGEMVEYISMLKSGGLLEEPQRSFYRITWAGHEFLDTIRDPEVWRKTKEGANKVGSWGLSFLAELGKGYIRTKALEYGLPIASA